MPRTKKKATKKKTSSRRASKKSLEAKNLIPADYNPREMDDESRKGLETSMKEFGDISGITWNKTTSNIVTGHHRWEGLINQYGLDKLTFEHLRGDIHAILADGEDTGYTLRQVEWDEAKEKAANIAANSHKIEGQFTVELNGLLEELEDSLDGDLFGDLRFGELNFDFDIGEPKSDYADEEDDDWDSNIEKIEKIDETDQQLYANITITCKKEQKLKLIEIVKKALGEADVEVR